MIERVYVCYPFLQDLYVSDNIEKIPRLKDEHHISICILRVCLNTNGTWINGRPGGVFYCLGKAEAKV